MVESYIKPESLSPAEVQQVLEFFNGAKTAEEIADAIKIPGEVDVGVRIAQRLLNRRDALGGEFTDIQQVAKTPYVGPERFTEIVTVLTGRSMERVVESRGVSPSVLQELRELKEMVRSLQASMGVGSHISMRLARPGLYLGQSAIILVEVRDTQKNKPKANLPLTLATSWGSLETHVGFEKRHGSIVTARTDINGKAKIKIIGPTYEQLTDAQQLALDFALRTLDPAAPTPYDDAPGLDNLVLQYQAAGNVALRQAMDIYFRTRSEALSNSINPPSPNNAWPYINVLVTAYLHEGEEQSRGGNVVESTAVLKVRVKDWIVPWYQGYLKHLEESCTITQDFNRFKAQVGDKGQLLDNMVNRLNSYASGEYGLVGGAAAKKVAQRQVNRFLSKDLEDLPFETRQLLFPALGGLSSKTVTTTKNGSLAVMGQVRTEINRKVDTKFAQLGDVGGFVKTVNDLKSQEFVTKYEDFIKKADAFDRNWSTANNQLKNFDSRVNTFNSTYSKFNNEVNKFESDFSNFNRDYTKFKNEPR
jgi:hypothetical protein